ncbi:MAG: hypothetical protein QNL12_06830 [Acidimicrobiia bacterium]|nr:hypothetical protein [Acidimicrobiia bacterium]
MSGRFEITGGAGHEETAAVAAVIAALVEEESAQRDHPAEAPRQSSWVLAWRPRDTPTPLPSHSYDARPWAEIESADGTEPSTS